MFFARHDAEPAIVRCVPESLARNKPTVARFNDEARLGRHLTHPGIVQRLDSGEANGVPYIAIEHVVGPTLAEVLDAEAKRAGRFSLPLALRIAADLLEALQAAHEAVDDVGQPLGVVHRDVSPENVLISREGAVRLTGFAASAHSARSDQTSFGTLRGRLAYSAPEALTGSVDSRSDLFSVGVLLYELLTLARPFDRHSEFHTLKAIREEAPPQPSSVRSDLPAELDALISAALAKAPGNRFPTAAAMRADIERVGKRSGLASSSELIDLASGLLPKSLQAARGAPSFAALLEAVGGTPMGRVEDELPGVASVSPSAKEVVPLVTAPSEIPNDTALQPVPDIADEAPPLTNPNRPPETPDPPTSPMADPPRSASAVPLPRQAPPEDESHARLPPVRPPPSNPRPISTSAPARASAPRGSPDAAALPPQRFAAPPAARPKRQRTLASRFRAPDERGLHPVLQLAIVALFAWAGVMTVSARKRAASTSMTPLLAAPASHPEEPLDTDTQVTDDDPEAPATLNPTPLAPSPIAREQKLAAPSVVRAGAAVKGPRVGTLVVEANPPSRISVDDKDRGSTPLTLKVNAGTHLVRLIAPNGIAKQLRLDVPPGKRVRKVVTFPFTPPQPSSNVMPAP